MAISKMKKLTLTVVNNVRDQLLTELQVLGAVHIDSLTTEESSDVQVNQETWHKELDAVSVDYSLLEDQRKELATSMERISELFGMQIPSFQVTSSDSIQNLSQKYDLKSLTQTLNILDRKTKESETAISNITAELDSLVRWGAYVDTMDPIHGTSESVRGVVGHISELSAIQLSSAIKEKTDLAELMVCWVQDKEAYCYLVADLSVWEEVNNILREHSFNILQITRRTGNVSDILSSLRKEVQEHQATYDASIAEWKVYSEKINDLALLHDVLEMEIQKHKAESLALSTEKVSFYRAWVPEDLMPKVVAILSIYEKSIDVHTEDPSEEEYATVPVLLKNNSLTRPFAALTTMYGTPMYGATVDPTPHLSIFYFIFYGICLGDALYGGLLALYSCWMMFKNRCNPSMSNFFALLAWSGFSAVIAGVIFGSYAGDLFAKYIPVPALMDLRFTFADGTSFFDKPLFVLFVSLLLGAIQLWYGYFIKFVVSIKNNGIEAIFDDLPWLVLLSGFFGWAVAVWIAGLAGLTLVDEGTISIFFLLIKVGAGLVILNNVRKGFQKGFVSGIVGPLAGAWELYGISGYLSNLLSYARLLALGLSSGIIAVVFNDLGFGIINSLAAISPVISILGVALLVFLHLFNLVLGGFGAFVHALRLQFVEFFGLFIEGGGKEFTPLARKGTHYTVK